MSNSAQDFYTIAAAFEAMLSRERVNFDYFASWSKSNELNYGDRVYIQWRAWARIIEPEKWITGAFIFEKQNIPACVWYNIDYRWNEWLKQNIKK